MKKVIRLLTFFAIVATVALPAFAQAAAGGQQQQCVDLYSKWRENRKNNQQVAYEVGKEFLQKCPNDEYVKYVKKFVDDYERGTRKFNFAEAIQKKDYPRAFTLGNEILAAEPEELTTLITLGWTGYVALTEDKDNFKADAARHATRALQLISSGKEPKIYDPAKQIEVVNWSPFGTREDTLGGLNFALGSFALKAKNADEAVKYFLTAAQQNGFTRKEPTTYANLATAYQIGEYNKLAEEYKAVTSKEGGVETPEAKALLERLNQITDRIIDAYARAIAHSGADPKYQKQKEDWMKRLTEFYKFRNNSDTGINELIANVLSKPLPTAAAPSTTATPTTSTPSASTQPSSGTTGDGAMKTGTEGTKPKP